MDITDHDIIMKISNNLEGFHKANNQYNFRAPCCGDSQISKTKRRGWLYEANGEIFYTCFNCDCKLNLRGFLKRFFPTEYQEYIRKKAFNKQDLYQNTKSKNKQIEKNITKTYFENIKEVKSCCENNYGNVYLTNRSVTNKKPFFYTDNYGRILEILELDDYKHEYDVHQPRLLIPHYNRKKELTHLQIRNVQETGSRYKTYKLIPDSQKIWGLENLDLNKKIFVTEGAIDASFIDNCIAMSGSDMSFTGILEKHKNDIRIILDNEPRNNIICEKYNKLINGGYKVLHWPDVKAKDINDCVKIGYDIISYIKNDENYFYNLRGKLDFLKWRK